MGDRHAVFEQLMADILSQDDVMLIIRNEAAICEARLERGLTFRIHEQWATIGDDSKPWHIHINLEGISTARFIKETNSSGRTSYSIRFYDLKDNLSLKAYFAKMYDKNGAAVNERVALFENLFEKYGRRDVIPLSIT